MINKQTKMYFFFLAAMIVGAALFAQYPLLLLLTFLILGLGALAYARELREVWVYVVVVLFSFLGEAFFIYLGLWEHSNPAAYGVPLWIPLSWGLFVLCVRRIAIINCERTNN